MIIKDIEILDEVIKIFEEAETEEFSELLEEDRMKIFDMFYTDILGEEQSNWFVRIEPIHENCYLLPTYEKINLYNMTFQGEYGKFEYKPMYPKISFTCCDISNKTFPLDLTGETEIMFGNSPKSLGWIKFLQQTLVRKAFDSIEKGLLESQKLQVRSTLSFNSVNEVRCGKRLPIVDIDNLFMGYGVIQADKARRKHGTLEHTIIEEGKCSGDVMKNFEVCGQKVDKSLEEIVELYLTYKEKINE